MIRPLGALLLAATVVGCFINGNGQAQGDAKGNGNGNAANNGNGNGNNGNVNPATLDGTKPADGTWDVTSATGTPIGPSQFVLAGSTASGFIASLHEGARDANNPECTITKDRSSFQLSANGNTLTGTFTIVTFWSGFGCPADQSRTVAVTGTRATPGKNDLDGLWQLTVVDGTSASASLQVATSTGVVVATSATPELAFAARQR
jgi:hypothetical protein